MRNIQFKQLYKLLKPGNSHAGFTLMELLSGVVMSTVVIGGLGYGLFQLTRVTRDEAGKVAARNDTSRAIQFIADELRRSQSVVDIDAPGFAEPAGSVATGGNIRLALNIPELRDPGTGDMLPVVYSVAPANANWQGDLVIYRWGPNFDGNGNYQEEDLSDTSGWIIEPLLDGLNDDDQDIQCNGTDVTYQGFYACRRTDGITAQLYFTSGVPSASEDYEDYTAEAQAVARARVSDHNEVEDPEAIPISFKTLGAEYSLGTIGGADCNGKSAWTMRTDFINDPNLNEPYLGDDTDSTPRRWIHDPDRQGQPININTNHKLTISSIPFILDDDYNSGSCDTSNFLSRGNPTGVNETSPTHEKDGDGSEWRPKYKDDNDPSKGYLYETSDFTIDFEVPATYNGVEGTDNPDPGVDHVRIYKKGSVIEYIKDGQEITLDGYDDDSTGTPDDGERS